VTADHWGFVLSAYGLAAVALAVYWRRLCRRDRELTALARDMGAKSIGRRDGRGRVPPDAGHPRSEPASPPSLQ
jgi:hypothetical protein